MATNRLQRYQAPNNTPSSVGHTQIRTDHFWKQALIEVRKEQYFMQLANVRAMPKNMGKTIKQYLYLPLLDDRNLNDQGLDAAGAYIDNTNFRVILPTLVYKDDATANTDITAIATAINTFAGSTVAAVTGSANDWTLTVTGGRDLGTGTEAHANAITALIDGCRVIQGSGNLYGSSKDIGYIPSKLPTLTEIGGRVNRVGFTRVELEGSFEKFGFFEEYTQESVDFDSDAELMMHINREMLRGANEMTEAALQIDLINAAGIEKYPGSASSISTVDSTVVYGDIMRLAIDLDNNRTPKNTKMITGTRMIDTKVIPAARVMYIGSELLPTLKLMTGLHNRPAFIPIEQYAAGGAILNGEAGSIDQFRVVVVPEMLHWEGAGASVAANDTSHSDNGSNYNVFPMLVVGDESFTTIGFQTDGKTVKFKIYHKKPGYETADRDDPYGEMGFMSIKWYYGFMVLRSERIALIRTLALL